MALRDYIYNKPVIETGRLILRPLVSSDIMALKEWMPDKSIYTYWGKGPGKSEKNPELMFEYDQFGNLVKDYDIRDGQVYSIKTYYYEQY